MPTPGRLLVLTSCTGEKSVDDVRRLTGDDFARGASHVKARERELKKLLTSAQDLYTGLQHVRLMRGVKALRAARPDLALDLWVLSAGYGLVPAGRTLAPYEATFSGMRKAELQAWAEHLHVPQDVRRLLAEPYDLALVLLGDDYLTACGLDDTVTLGGPTLVFGGKAGAARLPRLPRLRTVVLGNPDASRFACGLVGLKGEVAARLLERLREDPHLIPKLLDPATDVLGLLDGSTKASPVRHTARANPNVDRVIEIPESWWNKPHRAKLRYFIPEWDDLVDPDYDFETDTHSGGSGDWSNEVYAHQLYPEPNYDGLLVSKVVAEKSKKKKARINALGVHRFLRVPRQFPVMGDCGAFGYIHEERPPYTTDEILDYYTRLDFDYGVSIDHLIVTATEAQKKERYQLTIHNAEEFLKEHRKHRLPWTPVGAVQGWDPKSYAEAARQYVAMGYRYIGLGGLVRTSTPDIVRVLEQVRQVVPPDVGTHVFGVARPNALFGFQRLGVTSVDSASVLRQAWMRTKQSYLLDDGRTYAALRIPEAGKSFRAKHMRNHPDLSDDRILSLEGAALSNVREYARGKQSLESCLQALLEYDRFVTSERQDMAPLYRRTLEERPWEQCGCPICRANGVEVVIFRGNNRNRRRGFHNTYAFYRLFSAIVSGARLALPALDGRQTGLFDDLQEVAA